MNGVKRICSLLSRCKICVFWENFQGKICSCPSGLMTYGTRSQVQVLGPDYSVPCSRVTFRSILFSKYTFFKNLFPLILSFVDWKRKLQNRSIKYAIKIESETETKQGIKQITAPKNVPVIPSNHVLLKTRMVPTAISRVPQIFTWSVQRATAIGWFDIDASNLGINNFDGHLFNLCHYICTLLVWGPHWSLLIITVLVPGTCHILMSSIRDVDNNQELGKIGCSEVVQGTGASSKIEK